MSGLRALKRVRLRKRLDGETADVSGLRALKDCGFGEGKSFVTLSGLTTIWSSVPKCKQKYCLLAMNARRRQGLVYD